MDQEAAELYYLRYGTWPSWYTTGLTGSVYGAIRSFPIASTSLLAGSRLIAPTTLLTGSRLVALKDVEKKEIEVKDVDKKQVEMKDAKKVEVDMKSAPKKMEVDMKNAEKKESTDSIEIKLIPNMMSTAHVLPLGLNTWNTWGSGTLLL